MGKKISQLNHDTMRGVGLHWDGTRVPKEPSSIQHGVYLENIYISLSLVLYLPLSLYLSFCIFPSESLFLYLSPPPSLTLSHIYTK